MRVALFTDTYDEVNGVANTFRRLVRHCAESNVRLDVYAHGDGPACESNGSARVFRFPARMPVRYYPGLSVDLAPPSRALTSRFEDNRYDVIHLATPGSMGLAGLHLAGRTSPILGSYHTELADYVRARVRSIGRLMSALTWRYLAWFYRPCSVVLAPSRTVMRDIAGRLGRPVSLFSRGVDAEAFHPRFREPHRDVRVLYVGRTAVEKNIELLLELAGSLPERCSLHIVGDGPMLETIRRLHDDRVVCHGVLRGEQLSRAYASADVFAFPSLTDTFGNAVLEAMSSGLPCVVMDRGGPRDIVRDARDGFVAASASGFIGRVLDLVRDAPLRERMARAARDAAERRSWPKAFADLMRWYGAVAEGRL